MMMRVMMAMMIIRKMQKNDNIHIDKEEES